MKQKYVKENLGLFPPLSIVIIVAALYRIGSYIELVFHIGNEEDSKTNSMYKYINIRDKKFIHII